MRKLDIVFKELLERKSQLVTSFIAITLVAIGMSPRQALSIFYTKALILGAAGGVIGYLLGTTLAMWLGPRVAKIPVLPMPSLLGWALLISVT